MLAGCSIVSLIYYFIRCAAHFYSCHEEQYIYSIIVFICSMLNCYYGAGSVVVPLPVLFIDIMEVFGFIHVFLIKIDRGPYY